jgi:mono/diheme cytochrome c family protein
LASLLALAGCAALAPPGTDGETAAPTFELRQAVFSIDPSEDVAVSDELLAEGRSVYGRRCASCHGARGRGDGPAAYLLYPKPRNFHRGPFRFGSSWVGEPTDEDLFRVISRGIPGSAMPSWAHLTARKRWALVHYVKSLSEYPIELADEETVERGEGRIGVPPEPANTADSIARGAELFREACIKCHGPTGQGDGKSAFTLEDDDGVPIRPRDLTTGVFKGPRTPPDLYRRIIGGIPGTPMPDHGDTYLGDDAWHLVHFVMSLSSDVLRERAEMKRYRIPVVRVEHLPDHPDAGTWMRIPSVDLHLMPLWWRYARPEYVTVRAAHDGKDLLLQLVWADSTPDDLVIRPQDFRDAAAVQLALLDSDPPLFAMGEKGRFVNIWMWKAERQADLEGYNDLEAQYPNIGIDSYPNLQSSPYEQPMRHALTLESDPSYITAWGAGNIVADPTRRSAGEDLAAQGFGTLKARDTQQVHIDHAIHSQGTYRVTFRRSLNGEGEHSVELNPGSTVLAAFAFWNGAAGDRDGKKSVSIWQELAIQP